MIPALSASFISVIMQKWMEMAQEADEEFELRLVDKFDGKP